MTSQRRSGRETGRRWHATVERYTPDGALGRVILSSLAMPVVFASVVVALILQTAPGLWAVLGVLVSLAVALVAFLFAATVAWPVYLSLIGNVESAAAYPPDRPRSEGSLGGVAEDLKREYASGDLSQAELERRVERRLSGDRIVDTSAGDASDETGEETIERA